MTAAVLDIRHYVGDWNLLHWSTRVLCLLLAVAGGATAYAAGAVLAGLRPRHLRER
jgi:peptidoglycan biosynthesis protein MviN/MurJ (putative lipid II flippase)